MAYLKHLILKPTRNLWYKNLFQQINNLFTDGEQLFYRIKPKIKEVGNAKQRKRPAIKESY